MSNLFKREEFARRYVIKITGSVVSAIINAIVQMILPRIVSVEEYGIYSYNLNVFTAVVSFSLLSTNGALISKFAKRNDEKGLYQFFFKIFLKASFFLNLLVVIVDLCNLTSKIFTGQIFFIVLLGLNAAIVNQFVSVVVGLYDAISIPRLPTLLMIIQKILLLFCIFIVYVLRLLDLKIYYIIQIFITALTGILLLYYFIKEHKKIYPIARKLDTREYVKEFYIYCRPLVLANVITNVIIFARNWLLITNYGEREQAMYGIGVQLNTVIAYIFSPYAILMQREFALVHNQPLHLKKRLEQSLCQIVWISGYFAVYIFVCAKWIIGFLFGKDYIVAVAVVRAMMIYTIYQSYGQVFGSYLLATEQTKISAFFSFIFQPIEIVLVLLFQIPNRIISWNLGALGVGLTYAVGNFISMCVNVFYVRKKERISYRWFIKTHSVTMIILGVAAYIAFLSSEKIFFDMKGKMEYITKILSSGMIYTIIIMIVLLLKPEIVGLNKEAIVERIKRRVKK